MKNLLLFASLLLNFIAIVSQSAAFATDSLLGVSPEDVKYYKTASEFVSCKDGSKKIRADQLNDDFCDCPDGSDEPGTSACPNGKFYCLNAGHIPLVLFSSRVNDGICDCCDGSDEYDGKVKCPNKCWEAGKAARDKLEKKIVTYQQGVALRKKEIEQAKSAFAKDEAELTKLKNEEKVLKGLVEDLKERKEQIEKAEEKERLEKERLEKEKEAKNRKESEQEAKEDAIDNEKPENGKEKSNHDIHDPSIGNIDRDVEESGVDEDNLKEESQNDAVDPHAEKEDEEPAPKSDSSAETHHMEEGEASGKDESLSKEDLGRLVASRWTGENTGEKTGESNTLKDNDIPEDIPKDVHDEEYDGYSSDSYDDDERYDDHDSGDNINDDFTEDLGDSSSSYNSDSEDETHFSGGTSWIKKIKKTVGNILGAVNLFQTPVNISDASRVRKEFDEYSSKLSKMQSKVSSLSQKLKHDFGPEKEFYSFYGRCFESKESKYVYKICPYKQATQEEGHSTTRLGQWEHFEESYKVMLFSNGDKCWNGPDRSLKVRLRCGLENEITDVDEPSRCEYVAILSTPNVCYEEKLKELQSKLEKMNNQQPQTHDEL